MSLKFWYDPISEPSRTVMFILKKLNVEHEAILAQVVKDTRSEDFKKNVNPAGVVPVIEHDGTKIYESACICRFLLDTYDPNETLLPRSDLKKRAAVDYWLDWRNTSYRPHSQEAIDRIFVDGKMLKMEPPTEEEQKVMIGKMEKAIETVEAAVTDKPYLTGDELTIADVYLYTEIIEGHHLLNTHLGEKTKEWTDRVNEDEVVKELTDLFLKVLADFKATL